MMQHLVALLSIIYCKKTSALSFWVRWCWDHDQHTRICPVLRFLNPDQITFDILDSPTHFSHNNSHTPSAPYLLEAPVHRLSVFPAIRLHEQTGRIFRPQYPSSKKHSNEYFHFANPALISEFCLISTCCVNFRYIVLSFYCQKILSFSTNNKIPILFLHQNRPIFQYPYYHH